METYLIELYLPGQDGAAIAAAVARARAAARALRREGEDVRLVRSIFVPGDESCLCVWEAASADLAARASRLADLPFDRVVRAVSPEERPC